MKKTLQLLKDFCIYDFAERNREKALSLLAADIHWFGTSDHEDVYNLAQADHYISSEIAQLPTPYEISFSNETQTDTDDAFLRIIMKNQGVSIIVRITASSKFENGVEKLCAMHFSVADTEQQMDEYFPLMMSKRKIAAAKTELVMSTMAGGLLGCYIRPGLPFYFVNPRLLEYLGYADEEEFLAATGGLLANMIHPEDRAQVCAEIEAQLTQKTKYITDYRMLLRSGGVIWVHEIGQKAFDERGDAILIAVCYDITEEHNKQAQLDNMVNALPGGVALYRMNGNKTELLYQSRGVNLLFGRDPEEYKFLIENDPWCLLYGEDRVNVMAALCQAAKSDDPVSIDYRILHSANGYVWVNGSFKKAGMSDGCPIIHAVFTEMPQLRELFRNITEDSGVAIVVSDNKTHELLYLNEAVFSILHKTDRSYEGKLCHEYLLGSSKPCSFCKRLEMGSQRTEELYIPQLDRYYMTQGRTISWAGREAHIEYLTDITESIKAKQKFSEMLHNINCGVMVCHMKRGANFPEIEYMNDGLCRLLERSETALRNSYEKDLLANIHPDDHVLVFNTMASLRRCETHIENTVRYLFPDGRIKWIRVEINAVPHHDGSTVTYATFFDVTARMQQEQQLRDVIHTVPGGVCLYQWDGQTLHPLIVSAQFSAMLGEDAYLRMKRAKNLDYQEIHPDDLPAFQQAVRDTFQNSGSLEYTYRSFNKSLGEYRWFYMQGVTVRQDDGTQLAYVSYTDVTAEHQTAQDLRASERALDCATEEAGLWYWKYDPITDRAFFQGKCIEDFDLPPVLNHYPQSWLRRGFIPPEYYSRYTGAIQKIKSGAPQVIFESQILLKNSLHWVEFRFTNLMDEHNKPEMVVCTGHLIDDEKALLTKYELEKQKPSLGEKDLLFHAVFNLDTKETTDYGYTGGRLEGEYPTFAHVMTYVSDHIVDSETRASFLRLNDENYLRSQEKSGCVSFSIDYRRELPDKRILWVRNILHLVKAPNSRDLLLFEYCYDIHEQKMAEEVLHLTTVYDFDRIASVDFQSGKMTAYGDCSDLPSNGPFDYNRQRQQYTNELILPEDRARFYENSQPQNVMRHVAENGSYSFTSRIKKENGTIGVVKTRFLPYDLEHQIYIMSRTDVTDLLHNEEIKNARLRDALTVAQQANSAKSDFLAAMSHDIRTPMNAIVGMCELALEDEKDTSQVHESLKTIRSSSQLLLSLINNILDMSRIESGKMTFMDQYFSLSHEIHKTAESYRILAQRKHQKFEVDVNIIHDCCRSDIVRLHSVVDNLLSNAIKYTPQGGCIRYRVRELPDDRPGIGSYRFEIADNGIGISAAKQAHLFEPFYRGESELGANIEGTGLGLSIAKAIVDLKGGTISLQSEEGKGSIFTVDLPLHFSETAEAAAPRPKSPPQAYDLHGVHILLCEDHPVNQMVARRILEKAGASVTIAADGLAGYEKFISSQCGAFDAILMDVQMPKMNGHETACAIRQSDHPQAKTIPIIAMTANAFADDIQKSLAAGMNDHLAKPIVPAQIYDAILRCIDRRPSSSELPPPDEPRS